jgi:hypothetical protein
MVWEMLLDWSIFEVQSVIYPRGKENRTIGINSQYVVLFSNPPDRLVSTISLYLWLSKDRCIQIIYRNSRTSTLKQQRGHMVICLLIWSRARPRWKAIFDGVTGRNVEVGRLIEESRDAMLGGDVNSEGYITDCTSKIFLWSVLSLMMYIVSSSFLYSFINFCPSRGKKSSSASRFASVSVRGQRTRLMPYFTVLQSLHVDVPDPCLTCIQGY